MRGYLYSFYAGTGTRGCCSSEPCSWQNCAWCCCRRGPWAEKSPAGETYRKFCSLPSLTGFLRSRHTALLLSFAAAEICRLRWNWFYLILLVCLDVINYSSPLPSFHQFVTNPTAQQLNGTGREHKVLLLLFQVQLSIMSQRTSFLGARFCSHYYHYCTCTIGLNSRRKLSQIATKFMKSFLPLRFPTIQ